MIGQDLNSRTKKEKFFFDKHIFDEPEEDELDQEEEEDLPPPPPTFSEEELEQAKKEAFDKGLRQGKQEEQNSREEKNAALLAAIKDEMQVLFTAEQARESVFEREALTLTLTMMEKLFPYFSEKNGLDELKNALMEMISDQHGQSRIQVDVHPDRRDDIETTLKSIKIPEFRDMAFDVVADETLAQNACRLSWDDGGATHDADAMAASLMGKLKEVLAEHEANSHDTLSIDAKEETSNDSQADETVPGQSEPDSGSEDEAAKAEPEPENNEPEHKGES